MNVVREIGRINQLELENGSVNTSASWHAKYAHSPWCFVGNLPLRLTEGDVLCFMSQYGEIQDIHLVRHEETGESKGFAFVRYEDARSCVLAVDNFVGIKVLGRTLRIDHVEKYRLPKHVQDKDKEEEEDDDDDDKVTAEQHDKQKAMTPGHAYEGQELASSFDIGKGQDLFAPPVPPSLSNSKDQDKQEQQRRRSKLERKAERDRIRREREERRRKREERKRQRRARHYKRGNHHRDKDDDASLESQKRTRDRRRRRRRHSSDSFSSSGSE